MINFEVLYQIPASKREFGRIKLPNGPDLPELLVEEGWAKVREDAGRKEEDGDALAFLERLRELENQARTSSKGLWGKGGIIESTPEVSNPAALVNEYKGKKIDAIVERVLTGDRIIARMMLTPTKHVQTMIVLAGVRTPATKKTSPEGKDIPAEPYGTEAHQFVETRLHQRKVSVQLLGVTPQNQLVASVMHPKGNIAKFLLDAGLARSNDQHVTLLGNDMAQFRQAETAAKKAGKGVFTGAKATSGGAQEADYTCVRVLNAETLFLRTRAGEEKKITLSSVRQPKPSDPKQSPFSAEAKEFMRKKLIGKHVKVTVDGKKPPSEGFEEREVATVISNGKNAALMLVEAGFASVIRHRRDDDDRSPDYDALLLAEETAKTEEKGMWSEKLPVTKAYQDYSESLAKAKMMASVLQRQKKVPAVVDFVRGGGRFVVLVPRENAKLTFILSGIRVPKPARQSGEAAEPFGQEAADFANRRCMQRDVEIDVENNDKVGGFIGSLYIGRENFARALLEEGFAEVHAYSAEQSGNSNEYFAAEKKAKEARKGIWHDWDPSKEEEDSATAVSGANSTNGTNGTSAAPAAPRKKDFRQVMVTHVDEAGKLKIQQVGAGTAALTELMRAFKSFHINKSNDQALPGPPKVGDIVASKFTVDDDWYRGRVRRVDRAGQKVDITYIDYGNSETVPWTRLRPLSQPQFSTQKLKQQASDAVLSYLQLPQTPQYLSEAVNMIADLTDGKELVANVDFQDSDGTLYITLWDIPDPSKPGSTSLEQSLNAEVVNAGFAMVPKKLKAWEKAAGDTLASLGKLETAAKEARFGMWEYGDLTED